MQTSLGACAVRACAPPTARSRCQANAPRPSSVAAVLAPESSRRALLAGGAALLLADRLALHAAAEPAAATPAAPAGAKRAAGQRAAPPSPPPRAPATGARTGPPMTGPSPALLLTGYVAIGGMGWALTNSARENGDITFEGFGAAAAGGSPGDAAALKAGVAAADVWRAAANAEYEARVVAANKRAIEAKWYADYQGMLRNRKALKAQVARSAAEQVERNKAVSARASMDAVEQGVAEPPRKGGLLGALASVFKRGK